MGFHPSIIALCFQTVKITLDCLNFIISGLTWLVVCSYNYRITSFATTLMSTEAFSGALRHGTMKCFHKLMHIHISGYVCLPRPNTATNMHAV